MKFRAVRDIQGLITSGRTYFGTLVMEPELKGNGSHLEIKTALRIAVFNDQGYWRDYHPSNFVPTDA